jgi:hypothetical protein
MKLPATASFDPTAWIEKKRLETTLEKTLPWSITEKPLPSSVPTLTQSVLEVSNTPTNVDFKRLEDFWEHLVLEQLKKPEELLKLNPSRRESLGRFLAELSRLPEPELPQETLKNFVRMDRSVSEHEALKQLFRQIGFVQIAKALLLKSWSRSTDGPAKQELTKNDLKDLTAGVEKGLRPFIHLQTSTCQLIQRNFYSWYKLDPNSQLELWDILQSLENLDETKDWLLRSSRQLSAETLGERERYSKCFYQNIWSAVQKHKLVDFKSSFHYGFSPTLRDGSLMEHAPSQVEWIGFEPLSFELLFCEIRYFWDSPKKTPLWLKGSGLEMSMEQQTSMLLTHSGKQNSIQQMDAISACEVAFIAEESLIRTQSRSLAAQALRKQVDEHTILKKLKQATTTRGTYQACQALEKLRQDGVLIWAREELLTEASGKPALQFILNQAKILLIADFTTLDCESENLKRDLPKALYILKKENNLEKRKGHRPQLIKVYGTLKSPDDVTLLFDRVVSLVQKPEQVFPLEPVQIQSRVSPMDQREWEQHWFNPTDDDLVDRIEDLKLNSVRLGQLAVIRALHTSAESLQKPGELSLFSHAQKIEFEEKAAHGFYVWVENSRNGNEIFCSDSAQLPTYMKNGSSLFWVTPIQPKWQRPLQSLIRSQLTRDWFNYSVERKKGNWILRESDLQAIPVPRHINEILTQSDVYESALSDYPTIVNLVATDPGQALQSIEQFQTSATSAEYLKLKALAFVIAAESLHQTETHQGTLFSLISPEEQIILPRFVKTVLSEGDLAPLHQHPLVRFTASLSPHMAIQQISQVKFPSPGLLLTTSKGLSQQLYIQDTWLRELCHELMRELQEKVAEPTWDELCAHVRLPKNPTQAHSMSQQILRAFSTEKMKRKELNHLVGTCLLHVNASHPQVGLLQ